MKLILSGRPVPFFENLESENAPYGEHCLEVCVKMILAHLEPEKEYTLDELEKITNKGPTVTFASHYLMWLQRRGFNVMQIANFDWEAFRDEGADYYAKLGDGQLDFNTRGDLERERGVVDDFLASVPVLKRHPTVNDIATALDEKWLVRVSIDGGKIDLAKKGYFGHSVVVLGVEGDSVIFHDPGLPAQAYRRERREVFQGAMDSFGGMMDLIKPRGETDVLAQR
ncbi:MAG TPA: hypothetical protein VFZ48_03875 [Candidatus Saccharimonadales bacterium]